MLAVASGVIMTGFMMLLPLLPEYADQLGFSEYEIGLLVAAFFFGRVLFQFPLGVLSDYVGRRGIMSASLLLFAVITAAFALTTDAFLMIILRLMQGVAASGFTVGSQSYINDRTPTEFRGLANGVISSAINIGVIAGPILGATLSQGFSYQTPFLVAGVLGAVCFVISLAIPHMDIGQARAKSGKLIPLRDRFRRIMSCALSRSSLSLSFIHFLVMMAIAIFLTSAPILTAEVLDWSISDIAIAFAIGGAAAAISSPFLGRLADHIGRIRVLVLGLVSLFLEGLIVYLRPGTPLMLLAFALGGAGTPAYFNAFYSLIGDVTSPSERGAITGFIGSFGEWGSIIGSSLLVPITWRNIGVSAPMAADAIIAMLTIALVLLMKSVLQRQVARG